MSTPRPVTPGSILAASLQRLVERVEGAGGARDGIPDDVVDELRAASRLAGGLDGYLERMTTPPSPALAALAERTRTHDWSRHGAGDYLEQEMLSGHVEGQTLKMLVAATRARRVLEVGMFTGYSALAMAEAVPDDGVVVACEVDAEVAELARASFRESPAGERIVVEVGPAQETLARRAAAGEEFDLVFVDADKAGYRDYLATLLDTGLLAPHGLLCVDNTLLQGQPWLPGEPSDNGAAVAAFNDAVAADGRVEQVLLPVRDGLTLIRRVDPSW